MTPEIIKFFSSSKKFTMKLTLGFSLLVLATALDAHAAVVLTAGDTVKLISQVPGESAGDGGAFKWQVTNSNSSYYQQYFPTFCVELTQYINYGVTYSVNSVDSSIALNNPINSTGNTVTSLLGLFLFDQWSQQNPLNADGTIGTIPTFSPNATTGSEAAKEVQIALWWSEGYSTSTIVSATAGAYGDLTAVDSILTHAIADANSFNLYAWTVAGNGDINTNNATLANDYSVTDIDAMFIGPSGGNQDQVYLVPKKKDGNDSPVPEPASFAIWGMGICFAIAATASRRRWSLARQPK